MEKIHTAVKAFIKKSLRISLRRSLRLAGPGLILIVLTYNSCQTTPNQVKKTDVTLASEIEKNLADPTSEVSIMSYNVENLFDNKHDANREDYPYLPKSQKNTAEVKAFCEKQKSFRKRECFNLDWNDEVVKTKLAHIAQVILAADHGSGADNLMLIEVENINILKTLVNDYLKSSGYQTVVLLEGPDTRGIDPVFVSKFPIKGTPKLHIIPYQESDPEQLKWAKRSRGILEVTVTLPNKKDLTFLVAHFPSQMNPTAWRKQAVDYAKNLIAQYEKEGRAVIFGGDLNISSQEEDSEKFFKNTLSSVGQVSHLVGCKSCEGSHFYRGEWSFLDALVFSNTLKKDAGLELIPSSITDVRTSISMKRNGTPLSFRADKLEGASDHFPLYARLKIISDSKK